MGIDLSMKCVCGFLHPVVVCWLQWMTSELVAQLTVASDSLAARTYPEVDWKPGDRCKRLKDGRPFTVVPACRRQR